MTVFSGFFLVSTVLGSMSSAITLFETGGSDVYALALWGAALIVAGRIVRRTRVSTAFAARPNPVAPLRAANASGEARELSPSAAHQSRWKMSVAATEGASS